MMHSAFHTICVYFCQWIFVLGPAPTIVRWYLIWPNPQDIFFSWYTCPEEICHVIWIRMCRYANDYVRTWAVFSECQNWRSIRNASKYPTYATVVLRNSIIFSPLHSNVSLISDPPPIDSWFQTFTAQHCKTCGNAMIHSQPISQSIFHFICRLKFVCHVKHGTSANHAYTAHKSSWYCGYTWTDIAIFAIGTASFKFAASSASAAATGSTSFHVRWETSEKWVSLIHVFDIHPISV